MTSDSQAHDRPLATSSEPVHVEATPEVESTALQRMRLERDTALEDLAFLREQLRSTEAFYAHRFELAWESLHTEHRSLLDELTRQGAERQRPSHRVGPEREKVQAAHCEPADVPLLPRTR
jgi:hypothetical protein